MAALQMGSGGKAIPPYMDKVTNFKSDAKFVLLARHPSGPMQGAGLSCAVRA